MTMDKTLADILMSDGGMAPEDVKDCSALVRDSNQSLDRLLVGKGFLQEAEMLKIMSRYLAYPFRQDLRDVEVPSLFVDKVPVHFARSFNLVGIERLNGTVQVATCSPFDMHPMDDLATFMESEVDVILAPKAEITSLINRAYKTKSDVVDEALGSMDDDDDLIRLDDAVSDGEDLLDVSNKAPLIKLVNMILFQALKMRASDVHIQPFPDLLQVRYRIDGVLYDMEAPPKKYQDAIISRIKVMGKMDIAERRLPQDGRASLRIGESDVDVRISSVPTTYGERIVMRLLDKSARVYRLGNIGLDEYNENLLREYVNHTHGVIFVTGPTGSGKTTTLYAALTEQNTQEKNILTIEDPVEYNLAGISQVQVNSKKGLTFAAGLRSFLRQDPDIMMIGEVRDTETADIAIRAALTGHLVYSTLHTNDAASAVTRMLDIGVEPYLVASSVLICIAQRLVRVICPKCKTAMVPDTEMLAKLKSVDLELDRFEDGKVCVGVGCDYCFDSGYVDRTALYEMLPVNETVRVRVMERAGASVIKREAIQSGNLRTLRMDGLNKVAAGVTTIDEVLRVTQKDEI
ncbi:MAG: ATPase, T2SS/T4P/T4SS family [Planctomycetota bacterium]|jgi:general secretion pathway protein E|nr:ATPase, T2SS/T4P/T4SS family [Planctomycetota bacterium]